MTRTWLTWDLLVLKKDILMTDGTWVPGETTKFEAGAYFRIMLVKEVVKNVNLNTKLNYFLII